MCPPTEPPRTCLLGLDVGTSSCKAVLFDPAGHRLALAAAPCRLTRPAPGWVEQDPREAWRSVVRALRGLWAQGADPRQVAGIGLSGHFSSVFLDAAGLPAVPGLTWLDRRASAEAQWLAEEVGEARMARYLGLHLPLSATMPPARVLWLTRNRPQEMARVTWAGQTKDYVGWRLHGLRVSDGHSAMGLAHCPDGGLRPEYLALLGLSPAAVPPVRAPWVVAGQVTPAAARATGLAAGTPVVTGWIDSYCSMLGTGLADPTRGFDIAGTSEVVGLLATAPCRGRQRRGQLVIPLDASRTVVYGLTNAGADSLAWARAAWGAGASYARLLAEAEATPPGADGLLFLPYLEGERSPLWDERATGALLNLRRDHGRGHLTRAVLEGVAFSVRHNLECACTVAKRTVSGLRVSGGGALGAVWNQVKADVLGLPLQAVAEPETGALGAAMLAGIGIGWYADLAGADEAMVRRAQEWEPRPDVHVRYASLYRRYRAAYPALKGLSDG